MPLQTHPVADSLLGLLTSTRDCEDADVALVDLDFEVDVRLLLDLWTGVVVAGSNQQYRRLFSVDLQLCDESCADDIGVHLGIKALHLTSV